MTRRTWKTLWMATVVCLAFCAESASTEDDTQHWKAGIASVVVTPEHSMWMSGYSSRDKPSEGTQQDLFAKALALEDAQGSRLVIVTADIIGFPRPLRDAVEKAVNEKFGLPSGSLLLNASHTHSGPVVRVSRANVYGLDQQQIKLVEEYGRVLKAKLIDLVGQALEHMAPAQLAYSHARAGFAMNRRLLTEEGYRIRSNPDGPVDHDVPVLRVDSPEGELRAVLFGYACHNTTLNFYQFCGDYAGYAQQYLEEAHPGVTALFVTGCGADQNPCPRRDLGMAQQHGRTLATAVEAALVVRSRPVHGPLAVVLEEVTLEFAPPPSREELLGMRESEKESGRRHAKLLLDELERNGRIRTTYPYPIQVAQFGTDLTLVALAGEVVVDYSLRLKRELAGPAVWIAGYSNDIFNYVPSVRVLGEGGYEGVEAISRGPLPGSLAPSVEELVVGKVHKLVDKLRREMESDERLTAVDAS